MNICSDDHEEIVHEGRNCPMCGVIKEINDLEEQIAKEETTNDELRATIKELEAEIASHSSAS